MAAQKDVLVVPWANRYRYEIARDRSHSLRHGVSHTQETVNDRILKMNRVAVLAIVAFELLAIPSSGLAQTPDEELAKRYFKVGEELYNRSDYQGALEQFSKAYKYSKKPGLLFNIARCHESLGNLEPAIKAFEGYMTIGPDNPDRIKARIANLKSRLAEKSAAKAKQNGQLEAAKQAAKAAEAKAAAAPSDGRSSLTGWVVAGSGVALLATGVVFGVLAKSRADDLEAANKANAEFAAHQSELSSGETFQTVQIATLVAGGAAAIAGGVLLYLHYSKRPSERSAAWIVPSASPSSAGVTAGFSF